MFGPEELIGGKTTNCSYALNQLPTDNIAALRERVEAAVRDWGYDKKVKKLAQRLQGQRLLDVGMGQGPYGAAMMASQANLQYYVGLDPDVCPPVHARTRDITFPHRGSDLQCMKALYNSTTTSINDDVLNDPKYIECNGGEKKYRPYPITGLEMMAAYPGQLALLPGTFETLHTQLKSIVFDAVLLRTVTEHLSELTMVFAGLWELMGHCSANAEIILDHHNYYSYTGHHGYPTNIKEALEAPNEMMELADWGHVHPTASMAQKFSLNRVRPGDLQAMLNVYFTCTCHSLPVPPELRARLSPERQNHFESLGFDVEQEFFANHVHFDCQRRQKLHNPEILKRMILHHPPLDGSYKAQKLTCPPLDK
jgi:hypothetical protein